VAALDLLLGRKLGPPLVEEPLLLEMPTATIATMSTRETNQSLLSPGCADLVRQGRWVNRGLAGSSGVHGGPADDDVEPFRPDDP
jgi:hypothetical protein